MQDENEGVEADVPLIKAKKLDTENLVQNKHVRGYLERQGEMDLYYSLQVAEVVSGGIAITRIIAITENAVYKFPQTTLETGIFTHVKFPLSNMKCATIKEDEGPTLVEMSWENVEKPSDFTIRFREPRQKKEFLLTICHVNPDVPINYGPGGGSPIPHVEQEQQFELKERKPIPPRPVLYDPETEVPSPKITGDLTPDDLKRMVHLLCCPGHMHDPPDHFESPPVADDVLAEMVCLEKRNTKQANAPPDMSLTKREARLRQEASERPYYEVPDEDLDPAFAASPSPVPPPDEYYTEEQEVHLKTGDKVEVRDNDDEGWQEGTVTVVQGDALLIEVSDHFMELASTTTIVKVRPEGTDKAFSWRQLRVLQGAEIRLREAEQQYAEKQAAKFKEEEDERKRIRKMIDGMEMLLEQKLTEKAESQQAAAQRIAARQRRDDPRLLALREQLVIHSLRCQVEDKEISIQRERRRTQLTTSLNRTRREVGIESKLNYGNETLPLNVTRKLEMEALATQKLQEGEQNDLAETGSPQAVDAARAMQMADFEDLEKRLEKLKDMKYGHQLPDDKMLLSKGVYDMYARWRRSGGLTDGAGWSPEDTKTLLSHLKSIHKKLVQEGARSQDVARVQRMAGNVERERRMISNKHSDIPIDGQLGRDSKRVTKPMPFRLSVGSKPQSLVSPEAFKKELQKASRASQETLATIKRQHIEKRNSMSLSHSPKSTC